MQKLNDHQDDDLVNLNDGKVTNDMNKDFKFKLYWYSNLEISITTLKYLKQDAKILEKYKNAEVIIMMTLDQYIGTRTTRSKKW